MNETIQLFSEVTSCEEFQEVVVENKKSFWGERIGDCSFGGAGGKAILLNTPNGKEFVSYEQAFNGKGKFGKLLNAFFFGASEEDKLSVTDILNLIDENLSEEDIALLKETLSSDYESPFKLHIADVFGAVGVSTSIDVQEQYSKVISEYKAIANDKSHEDHLLAIEILNHESLILGNAICRYLNAEYDFLNYDFKFDAVTGDTKDIHLQWFARHDRPYIRRLASDEYRMYSARDVDALAKVVEKDGERTLELRLLCE